MNANELAARLKRHVGHQLVCQRESCTIGGLRVETIVLRCSDCGESVLEGVDRETPRQRRIG